MALLGGLAILTAAQSACGEKCLLGSCEDALLLEVTLPGEPSSYSFTFSTELGSTRCTFTVPLAAAASDCDEPELVRWAPIGEGTIEFSVLNSREADVSVTREGEPFHDGTVTGGPEVEAEGTADFCEGPCRVSRASLDLSDVDP